MQAIKTTLPDSYLREGSKREIQAAADSVDLQITVPPECVGLARDFLAFTFFPIGPVPHIPLEYIRLPDGSKLDIHIQQKLMEFWERIYAKTADFQLRFMIADALAPHGPNYALAVRCTQEVATYLAEHMIG
jgi:hypothetical protein